MSLRIRGCVDTGTGFSCTASIPEQPDSPAAKSLNARAADRKLYRPAGRMPSFTRSQEALLERQAALLRGQPVLLREREELVRQQPVAFS